MQHQIIALPQHGAAFRHNLPTPLTPLIGREREVASASTLLKRPEVHLLTLTGTGGVGKTRLGLQVATELMAEFSDGVFFVPLAPISDPDLVIPTIAQALQVREVGDDSLLDLLKVFLAEKQLLLLLDNFEQILTAAPQLTDLLVSCPDLKLLVTSRAVLHVQGEHELPVPPLALPDLKRLPDSTVLSHYAAVALFLSRTQAFKPDFTLTDANAPAVADICVRLDGLPLAIELAAARVKILSPQALLARLEHRLQVLTSGTQDAPTRQQTLRNTIAWSYDLLTPQEQRLFRRLSIFVGGCSLEAIEALWTTLDGVAEQVLDGVASLIDKSLLRQSEQEGEEPRFLMLETIREYGREILAEQAEMEVTSQAHAACYLELAETAARTWEGPQELEWFARLEREHGNLRAAMNWLLSRKETEMSLRLGVALWGFWYAKDFQLEGWNFLERALEGSKEVAASLRAKALRAAGNLVCCVGHVELGRALCQESLELFRELGDREGMSNALFYLAMATDISGDFATARSLYEECLALSKEAGYTYRVAWTLNILGMIAAKRGEYSKAHTYAEEGLALFRELSNTLGVAFTLMWVGTIKFHRGDLEQARAVAEELLALAREIEMKDIENQALFSLGEITLSQGDLTTARQVVEQSYAFYRETRNAEQIAWTLSLLGRVHAAQGDLTGARALYEESLVKEKGVNEGISREDIAPALEGLARVVAAQDEPAWASRLWGRAEAHREAHSLPLAPVYRPDYERSIAAAHAQLGEQAFATAWAQGRSMTLEQVLAAREPVQPVISSSEPSSPAYPDGLTAREVEVLRLVAQGLSNAEIAEQLIISLLTVKAHMRSLYNKLGISSRSAATRYAIEHGIV